MRNRERWGLKASFRAQLVCFQNQHFCMSMQEVSSGRGSFGNMQLEVLTEVYFTFSKNNRLLWNKMALGLSQVKGNAVGRV